MAFNTINDSEFKGRKLFVGYTPVKVLAVNPNKATLEKYFGPQQNDPTYLSTTELNGKTVGQVRIEFIIEAIRPDTKDSMYLRLDFFLTQGYAMNKATTKVQIIDKYGRTTWATNEDIKDHKIPVFDSGVVARIDKDYTPLIIGEDRLVKFIRALYCLNDPERWDSITNKYVTREGKDLERCEGCLDNAKAFFKGDFSELQSAVERAANNTVYVLLGVKTGPDGRQFQTVYTNCFVRKNRRKESIANDFDKALREFCPAMVEFQTVELKEFTVKPTDFGDLPTSGDDNNIPEAPVDDLPFTDNGTDW